MIPIIMWELKRRRNFVLVWCASTAALIAFLLAVYPSIHSQANQLNAVMQQLPASIRALRGGSTDLTSPVGYLNGELYYITLPLILSILSISLGGSLLAADERDHTLELLLARPVSRSAILAAKALAGVIIILLVGLIDTLAIFVMSAIVRLHVAAPLLIATSIYTVIFALSFGAIAFALSAGGRISRRASIAAAIVAIFGGYILESVSGLTTATATVTKLFPYHYYTPGQMLSGHFSSGLSLFLLALIAAASFMAWYGFRCRDIS